MKMSKTEVLSRLKVSLSDVKADEGRERDEYLEAITAWNVGLVRWRADALSDYGRRLDEVSIDRPYLSGRRLNAPPPPYEPEIGVGRKVSSFIAQVECVLGDEIEVSRGLLDDMAEFL